MVTDDPALNLRLALACVGLALSLEDVVRPYIERRELASVLEEFSTPFPGFYLYYPRAAKPPPPSAPSPIPAPDAAGAVSRPTVSL